MGFDFCELICRLFTATYFCCDFIVVGFTWLVTCVGFGFNTRCLFGLVWYMCFLVGLELLRFGG